MKHVLLVPVIFSVAMLFLVSAWSSEGSEQDAYKSYETIRDVTRKHFCPPELHEEKKAELEALKTSDQKERSNGQTPDPIADIKRRQTVAMIAATACLIDGQDYFNAAVIYQHGTVPEHYLQALIYARKANDEGFGPQALVLYELAIDRYLMSLGYAQLFGSQIVTPLAYKPYEGKPEDEKPCLWPVEKDFDFEKDYALGSEDYRQFRANQIKAQRNAYEFCDFPAKKSADKLQALLNLKL